MRSLAGPTSDLALQGTRIRAEWMAQAYGKRCKRESRMGMMAVGEEMCTVRQRTLTNDKPMTNTTKLNKQLESQDLGIGNKSNVLMHGSWDIRIEGNYWLNKIGKYRRAQIRAERPVSHRYLQTAAEPVFTGSQYFGRCLFTERG